MERQQADTTSREYTNAQMVVGYLRGINVLPLVTGENLSNLSIGSKPWCTAIKIS